MKNKFYELLSIILCVCLITSCFLTNLTTSATDTTTEITYYIDGTNGLGTNDGLSKTTAFQTFEYAHNTAVAAAKSGGYNTPENNVNFVILGTTQVSWIRDLAAHGYTLNISSENGGTLAGGSVVFKGDVNFSNITLNLSSGANFTTDGNNITFDDTVTFSGFNGGRVYTASYYGSVVTNPQTYTINTSNSIAHIYLGGYLASTYDADLTFNYQWHKNSIAAANVYFGGYSTNASSTYNKNVNLNFISATGINLNASNRGYTFGDDAAVHVINSSGKTISYDATLTADLFGDTAKVPTYEITNNTGVKNILSFTQEEGTFAVDSSLYTVTATHTDGDTAVSKDNTLVLTKPGKYTLSYKAAPKTVTYYIDATNGLDTNDGLSKTTAFQTFEYAHNTAVAAAKAGGWNTPENNVHLKVLNPPENKSSIIWAPDSEGATNTEDYNYTLNISTYEGHEKASLGGNNCSIDFKGPVIFDNVNINYSYYNSAPRFSLNGSNAVFKPSVTFTSNQRGGFLLGAGNASATYSAPQTVEINTKINAEKIYLSSRYKTDYGADLNLIYNASEATQILAFGSFAAGYTTTYKANVNLDLRAADSISLQKAEGEFTFDGAALQILNSTGNAIDYSTIEASFPKDTFIITNDTGVKDLLTFTSVAGTYTVDTNKYKVIATATDGTKTEAKNGSLVLTPGEYSLYIYEAASNDNAAYINDRGTGLANTYAKLTKDKKLNVVYFGGSITGGQGASDATTTSWRGLIGNWLKSAFPDAEINNYNYAYGGTGSLFGIYRLKQEVFPLEPDLVFVDAAINDRYNGLSADEIKKIMNLLSAIYAQSSPRATL